MQSLKNDISHFFNVFNARNADLFAQLDPATERELTEELALLRQSVLNRLSEETPAP